MGQRGPRQHDSRAARLITYPPGIEAAEKTYGKLVREKTGKGYEAITTRGKPAAVEELLGDHAMVAQQKLDGVRVLVHVGDPMLATNRAGQATQVAVAILDGLRHLPHGTIVDGEVDVGKVFAGTTNDSRKTLDALLAARATPVAEVKYLYATVDDQLYQPEFVRLRDDKEPEECARAQLTRTNRAVVA